MKVAPQPRQFSQTASFSAQLARHVAANPFRFIALRTLSFHGNSLLFSFQHLTHSFPSHGTRPSNSSRFSNFHFQFSRFSVRLLSAVNCRLSTRISLSSFFATLTNSLSRKSCVCHSYANTGGGTYFFPIWNSLATPRFLQYNPPAPLRGSRVR
jgi:hypothetical protein